MSKHHHSEEHHKHRHDTNDNHQHHHDDAQHHAHSHDDHHHHHDHGHQDESNRGCPAQSSTPLDTPGKLAVLVKHWINHNHDHARTYEEWAQKADGHDLPQVAAALRQAVALTQQVSQEFEKAGAALPD